MKRIATLISIAMAGWAFTAAAQQQPAAGFKPYAPSLADIMMMAQLRHAKLWLAGSVSNWELANFVIHEIEEGMESAAKHYPTYKGSPVGRMIEDTLKDPIENVEKAIKAQNGTTFLTAYDKLTEACNACHQASNHAFIVIQRPLTSPFPNQMFAPARK